MAAAFAYNRCMLPHFITMLPYRVHTNRELGLMLAELKPLAMFADYKDQYPEVLLRYLRLFDRHVEAGRFVRRDHFSKSQSIKTHELHRVLFALPSQEWRIDAMIDLWRSKIWTHDQERREGELLGYDDWMNDYWLDLIHSKQG